MTTTAEPLPPPLPSRKSEYEGLGGWLILVAIQLVLAVLKIGFTLVTVYLPLFRPQTWQIFTAPGSKFAEEHFARLLVFEAAGNTLFFLGAVVLLVLFFLKHRFFPPAIISYRILNFIFIAGDYLLANRLTVIPQETKDQGMITLIVVAASAAVWVPYFLMSERVKATFVR